MHYFLYPTKDTTISDAPSYMYKNMGLDEILEVEKRMATNACSSTVEYLELMGYTSSSCELLSGSMSASYDPDSTDPSVVSSSYVTVTADVYGPVLSRALLQFDLTEVSKSVAAGKITNPKFYLNLKVCESVEVPLSYTLYAYPISESWSMGTGYKYDGASYSDGVSWKFVDGVSKTWYTGSLIDCSGGGVWWNSAGVKESGSGFTAHAFNPNGYGASQSFDYQSGDVRMDITNMTMAWISGSIRNNGLIVMHSDESGSIDYGTMKFFSKETNTIYSPYVDVAWSDAQIDTGSADPIQIKDCVINMKNMTKEYKFGSLVRMDVTARKRYPIKTFTNKLSDYLAPYYLPTSSYYQIKDAESEEVVMPYDDYTQLSFDGNGNYFMLDTTGLPVERYFKVEIRTEQSGSYNTFTIPTSFKISR